MFHCMCMWGKQQASVNEVWEIHDFSGQRQVLIQELFVGMHKGYLLYSHEECLGSMGMG